MNFFQHLSALLFFSFCFNLWRQWRIVIESSPSEQLWLYLWSMAPWKDLHCEEALHSHFVVPLFCCVQQKTGKGMNSLGGNILFNHNIFAPRRAVMDNSEEAF